MTRINFGKWLATVVFVSAIVAGCSNDDDSSEDIGNWITSTVFDGAARSSAVVFTNGDFAYVGTGYNGDDYLKDFWRYNINEGYWEQIADLPGEPRSSAVAFTLNGCGYVGTGYNGTDQLKDFYRYDIVAATWSQVASLPGAARRAAISFSSGTAGYVGSGFDGLNDRKDFWKYNPQTDSWSESYGFGGGKRREAVSFTIDGTVYFGTGISNGTRLKDFWKFDTSTESWTRLGDLDEDDNDIPRAQGVAFAIGSYGYICGGDTGNTVWEYNPANDSWDSKTGIEAATRVDAIGFSNGSRGFVSLGKSGGYYFDDLIEFRPFDNQEDDD